MATIMLTGATGFLGGAVLAHLVEKRSDHRVLALIRASDQDQAMTRVRASLARFGVALNERQLEILCGDLTDAASLSDPRLDRVTHVLHAAANTSFVGKESVRAVNVDGAVNLARRMSRAPKLERFLHVGTAFSCGISSAYTAPLSEDAYPMASARHIVEYTRSKAEAEGGVAGFDLPLVIARPSVVVGHSTLGCAPSASLFWFYRAADLLRRVAWPMDAQDDVIPVDYAANALVALLLKPALSHARYHVSAGVASSCTWREIGAAFAKHHGERPDDPYRVMHPDEIVDEPGRIASRLGAGNARRMRAALSLYYKFPSLVFDNARLLAEGVARAPRFADYLDACMTKPGGGRTVYEQMSDDA